MAALSIFFSDESFFVAVFVLIVTVRDQDDLEISQVNLKTSHTHVNL